MPMQAQSGGGGVAPIHLLPRHYKDVGGQHHAQAVLPEADAL
jgi:hypothetical protein